MKQIANAFSILFHPLLIPTIGTALFFIYTPLFLYPLNMQLRLLLTVFLYTLILPGLALVVLRKLKIISDFEIHNKEERTFPYLIVLLSYTMCALSIWSFNYPIWVVSFIAGGALTLLINLVVTLKWKISAHAAGISALSGSIFALCLLQELYPVALLTIAIVMPGIMGSMRVYLKQHTVMQTIAGAIVGFLCTFTLIRFLIN